MKLTIYLLFFLVLPYDKNDQFSKTQMDQTSKKTFNSYLFYHITLRNQQWTENKIEQARNGPSWRCAYGSTYDKRVSRIFLVLDFEKSVIGILGIRN